MDTEHGKGGSYTRDPATGARTLVERTEEARTATVAEEQKPAKASQKGGEK